VWVPLAFSALWVAVLLLTQQFMAIMIVIWILFVPFWAYQTMGLARRSQRELDELNASFR
jgi:Flp pilus assembly protein TadB